MEAFKRPAEEGRRRWWRPRVGRWLRLALVILGAILCAGVIPGAALLIPMMVEANVYSSLCGESSGGGSSQAKPQTGCEEQSVALSNCFNMAMLVSAFGVLPGGMLLDRRGGLFCGLVGSVVSVVGLVLLQVPLIGAQYGYDARTSSVMPVAVVLTDLGSFINSNCVMSIVWHFYDVQTFIFALVMVTYQLTSFSPYLMQFVMRLTGATLANALLCFVGLSALGGAICGCFTPTQEEFREAARKALGMPLPKPKAIGFCKAIGDSHRVMAVHWRSHLLFCTAAAVSVGGAMVYSANTGEFGKLLLGGRDKDWLADLYVQVSTVVGCTVVPAVTFMGDKLGLSSKVLALVIPSFAILSCFTVAGPSKYQQGVTGTYYALVGFLYQVLLQKYILSFCLPTQFGVTQGVLVSYTLLIAMPVVQGMDTWILSFPSGDVRSLTIPLQGSCVIGTVFVCMAGWHFYWTRLPEHPVLLKDAEGDLALPFGCKDLSEVMYVTHIDDLGELLRRMNSTDPAAFSALLSEVDVARVAELAADPVATAARSKPRLDTGKVVHAADILGEQLGSGLEEVLVDEPPAEARQHQEITIEEVTVCAVSCEGPVGRARAAWSAPPFSALLKGLACCQSPMLSGAAQPLLSEPDPEGSAAASESTRRARERAQRARAVNKKILAGLEARDAKAVFAIYEREEPELLWEAYQDLFEWLGQEDMKLFEQMWEDVLPADIYKDLMARRPALRVPITKMIAYRMKKATCG